MCAKLTALETSPLSPARSNLQKAATILLSRTLQKRDFSQPISVRASRVLGPTSRHHVAQIIPLVRNAARASRSGVAVGILRVLYNGMCATTRFHVENGEHSCRVRCRDEPDCLSHSNKCPPVSNIFGLLWRNAEIHPRESHIFCIISSPGSYKQACNVGLWSWDSLMPSCTPTTITVTTWTTQENFTIAWRGEFALMTAITPAYAHAYRAICLARRPLDILCRRFRPPSAKAKYPNLPNIRTSTRNIGDDHEGWGRVHRWRNSYR